MTIVSEEEWERHHEKWVRESKLHQALWEEHMKGLRNEMNQVLNIVTLANNEHPHPSLNEEYERIATKYHNKEITFEEFLEEYEMLKVALKLIDT
ncbi:hypothetical protein LCGC14_1922680 [marine sediment metagenome]|uniref:Uncharacterized protein n=1 Tax=marine sediment metagenome TaxID=412755 RepID=A0A0F9FR16_9ZZZZ